MGKIKYIIGNTKQDFKSLRPFDDDVIKFLNELSCCLIKDKESKKNLELFTFSIWCRESNIRSLIKDYNNIEKKRMHGLGIVFHIPPSNVIMNFAYSMVIGLVTGNKNIIRIPSKSIKLAKLISIKIKSLKKKYSNIVKLICFINYDYDKEISKKMSIIADARIIWGSDETVNNFKKIDTKINCRDIIFSDKYSISIINSEKIIKLDKKKIFKLCKNFYNDTYLFDQNACTAPQTIFWIGKRSKEAKNKFWGCMEGIVLKNYKLDLYSAVNKFDNMSTLAFRSKNLDLSFYNFKNLIIRANLKNVKNLDKLRGKWGFFYEKDYKSLNKIKIYRSKKYQSVSYFGFLQNDLLKLSNNKSMKDFCRYIKIGDTMKFNFVWDGYDLIHSLTKKIKIN